jgi:uncharacterized protein (DUF362 family)/Pyruvate/2-oxoacid:ferredoxin oxidoreductase delta subunit
LKIAAFFSLSDSINYFETGPLLPPSAKRTIMSTVALIKCESYDLSDVKDAVQKGINLLGGVSKFAKSGEKILLKPNFLIGEVPGKCVNTNPRLFRAVAELFQSTGALLSYGDSPAFGSTAAASKKAGFTDIAEELGIPLADFKEGVEKQFPEGRQNKKFTIAKAVTECDGVISLPKLKTHGFLRFTGCVKNQFGCIPGLLKAEFHVKCPDAYDFAKMLVDLNACIKPRLYIMDAVFAMEGNGPRGGNPRKLQALLFSEDPVACDAVACRLINCDPLNIPTITIGQDFGAGTYEADKIELVGDDFNALKVPDFDINRSKIAAFKSRGLLRILSNIFVSKPTINKNKCIRCGMCVQMCPVQPKAVDWDSGDTSKPPVHNYHRCIRCYCCQEICPEKAIGIKKPLVRRFF